MSRLWCAIAGSDEFWEQLCQERFGVSPKEIDPPPDPTKLLYILTHRSLQTIKRSPSCSGLGGEKSWQGILGETYRTSPHMSGPGANASTAMVLHAASV